ncbi:hypothetical protein [Kribbella sindirgiensis]|uniref:Uncharacterized protein n=1 Tax=Kribbella sindirgiensis TaxID=1124744 RepID=A0A4R0I6R3_9ACTN|nr:hypothetical protein [Kribbella sindirgiensis]TCC21660.1 hypothetical protein E0H50_35895 [Kribbella sindirgiensis]
MLTGRGVFAYPRRTAKIHPLATAQPLAYSVPEHVCPDQVPPTTAKPDVGLHDPRGKNRAN